MKTYLTRPGCDDIPVEVDESDISFGIVTDDYTPNEGGRILFKKGEQLILTDDEEKWVKWLLAEVQYEDDPYEPELERGY